jgi:hypothetical protein
LRIFQTLRTSVTTEIVMSVFPHLEGPIHDLMQMEKIAGSGGMVIRHRAHLSRARAVTLSSHECVRRAL